MTAPAHCILFFACLTLAACVPDAAPPLPPASFPISTEPLLRPVVLPPTLPLTSIEVLRPQYEAGRVRQGRTLRHRYTFTNTGREPLQVDTVYASCSCVLLDQPTDAIAPGQRGTITVAVRTRHLLGQQQQAIVVAANTVPAHTTLYLSALVEP